MIGQSYGHTVNQQFYYGRGYYQTRRKWPDLYNFYPRGLKTRKDLLKAIYFFPSIIIEPLRGIFAIPRWDDRFIFPLLRMMANIAHRAGYIRESFERPKSKPISE